VAVRDRYDVLVLAANHDQWRIAPGGDQSLSAGDRIYAVGSREALAAFEEVAI